MGIIGEAFNRASQNPSGSCSLEPCHPFCGRTSTVSLEMIGRHTSLGVKPLELSSNAPLGLARFAVLSSSRGAGASLPSDREQRRLEGILGQSIASILHPPVPSCGRSSANVCARKPKRRQGPWRLDEPTSLRFEILSCENAEV